MCSTWVEQTCGCKEGVEVDVNYVPDEVRATASCERGRTGAALTRIPWENPGEIDARVLVAAVVRR